MFSRRVRTGIVIGLLPATVVLAQEPGNAELQRRLDEQEQRTRVLERKLELQDETAKAALPSTPVIKAGVRGFSISSPDNANVLKFRGLIHIDGRYLDDDADIGGFDQWTAQRVRPIFEGTLGGIYDFRFTPDYGQGRTVIQDAYVTARFRTDLQLTAGKFKSPVGLERLQSASDIRFLSRGFPTSLAPNRDIGLQIGGNVLSDTFSYQLAFLNGSNDGGSSETFADAEVNDDKEWALRLFAQPFVNSSSFLLRGLGFGVAGTTTDQQGSNTQTLLPAFRTPATQTFFSYRSATAATGTAVATNATIADGDRIRISPQLYYYVGSFGLLSEYIRVEQDVSRQPTAVDPVRSDTLENTAWQVQLSWFATGEEESFKGFTPNSIFTIGSPGWGAFEFVARYQELEVDDATFVGGAASFANPATSSSEARSVGVGANWYLNQNLKWHVGYEVTSFEGGAAAGADRDDEKALLTRFQVNF